MAGVKLWVHEPIQLVKHPTLVPDTRMCNEELVNTFTRIVVVIAVVFLVIAWLTGFIGYVAGLCFLIVGVVVLGVIGVLVCHQDDPKPTRIENFRHRPRIVRSVRSPFGPTQPRNALHNRSSQRPAPQTPNENTPPKPRAPRRHQRYPR